MTTKDTIKLILSSPEITNVVITDQEDMTPNEAVIYLLEWMNFTGCWRTQTEGKHLLLIYH